MAFSQSLIIGDRTLNELDIRETKKITEFETPPCKRKNTGSADFSKNAKKSNGRNRNDTNNNNNSSPGTSSAAVKNANSHLPVLDMIDESPTDKPHVFGETIKERLRNASVSKKSNRKYLRRSKSDPLSKNQTNQKHPIDLLSYHGHGMTEEYGSMFDDTMEHETKHNTNLEIKKNEEACNFEGDSFDKYFQDIQTQLKSPVTINANALEAKTEQLMLKENLSELFDSKFSMEMENVNVSQIEQLISTRNETKPNATFNLSRSRFVSDSEDIFFESETPNGYIHSETMANENNNLNEKVEWEESEFFNDLNTSIQNELSLKEEIQKNDRNNNELRDANDNDPKPNLEQFIADEINSCKLDITTALSELEQSRNISRRNDHSQLISISRNVNYDRSQRANNTSINDQVAVQPQSETDIRNLIRWGCSDLILTEYRKKGIQNMFQWQADCLANSKIQDNYKNLVYSAPTSAGKTFVSEILMIRSVVQRQKKVIIILPFISVVREKMYYLQDLLRTSGIRVEGFFGGYTPPGGFDSIDIAICTIEKANSIVNKLLEQNKIDAIGLIVIDEVHLISDPGRGYILELLLAKTLFCSRKLHTNIQIVTMSATLPNADLLTKWLDAEYFQTNYRPIDLHEMIKIGKDIFDNKMNLIRSISDEEFATIQNDQDNVGQLCIETIADGSAVIVFCPSKDWCESLALHVAGLIYKLGKSQGSIAGRLRKEINMQSIEEVKIHLRDSPTGLDSVLEKTISYGVAFHHAGLTFDERDIIESAFSNGSLRIIVATSTLSSGVNLPARRVIIRTPLFGGKQMSSLTYKQMIGRAGRMGKDKLGEAILICSATNAQTGKALIGAELKPLTSCLDADNYSHFKRAILEIIASGMATTKLDLENFIKCTLFHSEHNFEINYFNQQTLETYLKQTRSGKVQGNSQDANESNDPIGQCMQFLEHYEFIRLHFNEDTREMNYVATRLGHACLASSMPPNEGFILFSELQKARQSFVLESELHAVYLVTPFSVCYQLQDIDWLAFLDMWEKLSTSMQRVGELVGVKESFLVKAMRGNSKLDHRSLQIHKRFYTALALQELINEIPINDVAVKYKFTRGVLQSLQQTASTFAGIVTSFCHALNWELLALIVSQFKDRLFFGVHQDLIDIMKIPILNSQRARALHNAGFHSLVDLSSADTFKIEKCLYDSISFDTKLRDGETNFDAQQRNKKRLLFVTGKAGLTVSDAAKMIIDDARLYLKNEMRLTDVMWSQHEKNSNVSIAKHEPLDIQIVNGNQNKTTVEVEKSREVQQKSAQPNENEKIKKNLTKYQSKTNTQANHISTFNDVDSINMQSTNNESLLLNSSHILSDSKIDNQSVDLKHIKIIDVFKNAQFFQQFSESFHNFTHAAFDLALAKQQPNANRNDKIFNCIVSESHYIAGISLCIEGNIVFYLNLQDSAITDSEITFVEKISFIKTIFSRNNFTLKITDAKDQLKLLLNAVPEIEIMCCCLEDPKIAHWLLQPDVESSFHRMVLLYAPECTSLSESIAADDDTNLISPRNRASVRACITERILRTQIQNLQRLGNGSIFKAFKDMEMVIQKSLLRMELNGIAVKRSTMETLNLEINECMKELEGEMYRMNGKRFQTKSSREIAQILKIRNKNGTISAKCTRSDIENSNLPIARLILEHRKLNAILSQTIQPLLKRIVGHRIYGNSISFTSTGRISMHEPNLQNVAKDFVIECANTDSENQKTLSCRSAFKVQSGRELISADFCQLELRVLAHLSEDESLIDIFYSANDIFTAIASKWNKIRETQVTDKLRNDAKQICYGIIYGMGIQSLATALKCDEDEANNLFESFHKTYPGIRNFTQKIVNKARDQGFVETLAGRRRYLPSINVSDDVTKRSQAERQAINTTIQGSAADIAKYAMIRMERNMLKYQTTIKVNEPNNRISQVNLVLHLHDELMYEVPIDKSKQVIKILKSSMENCAKLAVPLKVKIKKGISWGTMKIID